MKRFWRDFTERVVLTYVETFVGLLIAAPAVDAWSSGKIDMNLIQTAAVAAIPATLSAFKSLVASFRGNGDSASLSQHI